MLRRSVQSGRVFARQNHHITFKPNKAKAEAFRSFEQHSEEHAKGTTSLWRNISLACIPVLGVCAFYVYPKEKHHIAHMVELNKLPDDEWPTPMEYQNMRTKPFFWGNGQRSVFWGPTNHLNQK